MATSDKILGIDLGTTNSVAAILDGEDPVVIPNAEGHPRTPSIVHLDKSGKFLVGEMARRLMATHPERTIFSAKRLIGQYYSSVEDVVTGLPFKCVPDDDDNVLIAVGDKLMAPPEVSAKVLEKIKKDAEAYLGEAITQAIITVPASFNDLQRTATKEAGRLAGLEVLRLVNEPTAAAMAYGLGRGNDGITAVYDFGGGTFDITLMDISGRTFEVIVCEGDNYLGGDDLDATIMQRIVDEVFDKHGIDLTREATSMGRLKEAAEKAKCEVSSVRSTTISLPFLAKVKGEPINFERTFTRAEFEEMAEPFVERSIECCKRALEAAKLKREDIDKVLLVGGTTRIPLVQQMVEEFFGQSPSRGVNPDEIVALGAATQGGVLAGNLTEVVLLDVTPRSLGIATENDGYSVIIQKNSTIPIKAAKTFTTTEANQEMVQVHVLQGEEPNANANISLGKFLLRGIQPAGPGVPRIRVTFHINADGILEIGAQDMATGTEKQLTITHAFLNEEERKKKDANAANRISQGGKRRVPRRRANSSSSDSKTRPRPSAVRSPQGLESRPSMESRVSYTESAAEAGTPIGGTPVAKVPPTPAPKFPAAPSRTGRQPIIGPGAGRSTRSEEDEPIAMGSGAYPRLSEDDSEAAATQRLDRVSSFLPDETEGLYDKPKGDTADRARSSMELKAVAAPDVSQEKKDTVPDHPRPMSEAVRDVAAKLQPLASKPQNQPPLPPPVPARKKSDGTEPATEEEKDLWSPTELLEGLHGGGAPQPTVPQKKVSAPAKPVVVVPCPPEKYGEALALAFALLDADKSDANAKTAYHAAQPKLDALLNEYPNDPVLLKQSAALAFVRGDAETALGMLRRYNAVPGRDQSWSLKLLAKILDAHPGSIEARAERAELLSVEGKFEGAIKDLEFILARQSGHEESTRRLEEVYKKLLESRYSPASELKLIKVLLRRNKLDEAIKRLQNIVEDPQFRTRAQKVLGFCYWQKQMYYPAYLQFKNLDLNDEIQDTIYRLGCDMEAKGDTGHAHEAFEFLAARLTNFRDVSDKISKLKAQGARAGSPVPAQLGAMPQPAAAAPMPPSGGDVLKGSRFIILEELNRGSMGIVFKAKDQTLNEIVALKVLNDFLCTDPLAIERFKREARAAKKLSHQRIVRIHDLFEMNNKTFLSMEYIEGEDLKKLLGRRKKMNARETSLVGYLICDALEYAHKRGVVHRDIKPANILLEHGNPSELKVADFGIAKQLNTDDMTTGSRIMGTPLYMAPEQIEGRQVDARSDIYALGIMMYEMIMGNAPYNEGNIEYQHIHMQPPALSADLDPGFSRIVLKCIEKRKEDRFQSALDLSKALAPFALANGTQA